jgi:ParB family chromosome partitioning protein
VKKLSLKDRAMAAVLVGEHPETVNVQSSTVDRTVVLKPKTGPGTLMAHLARDSDALRENEQLRSELNTWADAVPVRKLDASFIGPSSWANRHQDSYSGADFVALKEEIQAAGGNIQPIKVRPLVGANEGKFEVVFGHRRHRACLELGLPVLALVEAINDRLLFIEMDRENRQRADLRPYEQGEMYRRALDSKLFPSMRKMAEEIGVPVSQVSKAHQIAALPSFVLEAFASPLDIQFRWGQTLADACRAHPERVAMVATELIQLKVSDKTPAALKVFELLTDTAKREGLQPEVVQSIRGSATARILRRGGKLLIELDADSLSEQALARIKSEIANLMS